MPPSALDAIGEWEAGPVSLGSGEERIKVLV
jgi:hypothetical protein